ncbi:MAG: hypothetical protein AAF327_11060 [Cyanobacteria bacterium P01_A01_bin.37]
MTSPQSPDSNRQSFTISNSTLSDNVQMGNTAGGDIIQSSGDVLNAGRDINQGAIAKPTSAEVMELFHELEALVTSSSLAAGEQAKALKYLDAAKEEAQADEPEKEFALKGFQKATQVLKEAGDTVEATSTLWKQVEAIASKLAPWFGVAAKTLLLI